MLTESEALGRILDAVPPLPPRRVPLEAALNRFAATPLLAMVPLPGFHSSAMDGYALQAADSRKPEPLRVTGTQPAGLRRDLRVGAGEAVRIFTGAPVPTGADAVIMQEDVTPGADGASITCREPVAPSENVRPAGCDICVGQRILETGDRLTAARLALLASQGLSTYEVTDTPRVAIATTGDELAPAGALLQPGQIHDSNGVMLQSMLAGLSISGAKVRHLPDDPHHTTKALRELIGSHDFVILCGGVSVGDHDCVRPALQALRIEPGFWRVRIKPGKPLLFTQSPRENGNPCTIFGLPGNPVSAFVTFLLFARPALLKAMGAPAAELPLPQARCRLQAALKNEGSRPHYVRGFWDGSQFTPQGGQRSHELGGLARSNALLRLEPSSTLDAGAEVTALLFA